MGNEDLLLKDILKSESKTSLKELFQLRTNAWKYWMISGEGGSWSQFSDLTQKIDSFKAFNLIPTAIEICIEQEDPDLFDTALSLLSSLVTASNTTEIPIIFKEKWEQIILKAEELKSESHKVLINNSESWYRINQ